MSAAAEFLSFVTILHFTTAGASQVQGCCFTIGYAAMDAPCCLKVERHKGQSDCLNEGNLVGGKTGWNPYCPASADEANKWLTKVQTNPLNCPPRRPDSGAVCTGSQDCHYNVYICPDGAQYYQPGQCIGVKKWTVDAHVCMDGTTHHKVHALCVNGAWVVSSLPLGCQDCLANMSALGDAGSCALVTKGDAEVAAHKIHTCMVVGGKLTDGSPNEHAAVDGPAYVNELGQPGRWNFNGGGPFPNASVDFARLEALVTDPFLQNFTVDNYTVFVLTKGGTIHQGMFGGGQPENNGKTLVIFNTRDPITVTFSDLGRQFGPSILAPFSDVTLLGKAGYIDGCVIAKSFKTAGQYASGLQLHGDCYRGPLCSTKPFPPKPPKPTWWWWIVGVGAGVAAVAAIVPLAVTGGIECAKHRGGVSSSGSSSGKYSMEDVEGYKLGERFGKARAYPILFALVVSLVIMSLAVARFRSRNQRTTRAIHRDERQEVQEEDVLE